MMATAAADDDDDVADAAAFVRALGARAVALQFPDELLGAAAGAATRLAAALGDAATRVAVLGDTSFGSCCVDEVAAAHLPADAVVHFGPSCLSPPSGVPALHVFERHPVPVDAAAAALCALLDEAPAAAAPVLLLFDTAYAHALPALLSATAVRQGATVPAGAAGGEQRAVPDVSTSDVSVADSKEALVRRFTVALRSPLPARLVVPSYCRVAFPAGGGASAAPAPPHSCSPAAAAAPASGCACEGAPPATTTPTAACAPSPSPALGVEPGAAAAADGNALAGGGGGGDIDSDPSGGGGSSMTVLGLRVALPARTGGGGGGGGGPFGSVWYLGHRPSRLRAVTAQFAGAGVPVWAWDPRAPDAGAALVSTASSRLMSQRYRMVEVLRGAGIIGIVAGTLGVARHADVIAALRAAAARAGKAAYTFLVGKLSPAKLGNFPEVDAFVLVACPECALLDEATAAGFVAPMATPQEALIALLGGGAAGEGSDAGEDDGKEAVPSSSSLRWTGCAEFDFSRLLHDAAARALGLHAGDDGGGGGAAFFSLIASGGGGSGGSRVGGPRILPSRPWQQQQQQQQQQQEPAAPSTLAAASESVAPPPSAATAAAAAAGALAVSADLASRAALATLVASGPNAGAAATYLATQRQWRGLAYDYSDAVREGGLSVAEGGAGADSGGSGPDGTDPEALALALAAPASQLAPSSTALGAVLPPARVVQGSVGRAAGYAGEGAGRQPAR